MNFFFRLFSLVFSYAFLAYPGNIIGNVVALNRTPSVFISSTVFPVHVCAWIAVNMCPLDLVHKVCKLEPVYTVLNAVGALDNMTTAMGFMMYATTIHPGGCNAVHAIFAGVCMNIGGRWLY